MAAHVDTQFGNVPDTVLPRLLDMGQCNDAYGAVVVAKALAGAFKTDINSACDCCCARTAVMVLFLSTNLWTVPSH